jgi:hypothetical protein
MFSKVCFSHTVDAHHLGYETVLLVEWFLMLLGNTWPSVHWQPLPEDVNPQLVF